MKIITIISAIIVLGAALVFSSEFDSTKIEDLTSLNVEQESKEIKRDTVAIRIMPKVIDKPQAKTREDFLKDYEKYSTSELQDELKRLEELKRSSALIERANRGEVNEQLSHDLTEYLRADFVVRNLILERKLDELEELL